MILQLGLTNPNPVWIQVLDQEKTPYQLIQSLNPEITPVVIFAKYHSLPSDQIKFFFSKGGFGIVDQSDGLANRFQDRVIKLDFKELEEKSTSWKAIEKKFIFGDYWVMETAAQIKKSYVREQIVSSVKEAFWKANLPYVHLWYYPTGYETVFSFRFDLDEHDAHDFETLCSLIKQYGEMITCFVCTKTYEPLKEEMKRLSQLDVEIASHAYVHHVYNSYRQNEYNISKAEQLLKPYGSEMRGFAGPHGKWHPSLEQVLEEHHYLYSSEFCLDYDNFPLFPLHNGRLSKVLHLATHPVCEGVFLERYPYNEKMFDDYYFQVIKELEQQNLPILIFGHPDRRIGRYPDILHHLIRRISQRQKIWKTCFKDFAAWWIGRHNQIFTLYYDNDTLCFFDNAGLDSTYSWEIILPNGNFRMVDSSALIKGLRLNAAHFSQRPQVKLEIGETPVSHTLLKRLKLRLKNLLDWEVKTPLKGLDRSNLSGVVKYLLRLFYDIFRHSHAKSLYS